MTVIIKSMETPEEIEGKSLVHWQTWREAYDDLLPAEFQETMTLERCRFFSQKYPENTLIAIGDLKVVGLSVMVTFVMRLFKLVKLLLYMF
ncbi:acetyltransferase, gnat family [Streptococcus pneumoniae]|nr:acetyltransferase, gnat family [Streptococcus pneumoniae]